MDKKAAFEYILFKLEKWFNEYNPSKEKNDLSKLKVIKLHFFVCASNSEKNQLLNLFNKFCAMPYGHVESDVYNFIDNLDFFIVTDKELKRKTDWDESALINNIDSKTKEEIDDSVTYLKENHFELISYSALQLVEISHLWFSWRSQFSEAKRNGKYSHVIPSEMIKEENKYYHLN